MAVVENSPRNPKNRGFFDDVLTMLTSRIVVQGVGLITSVIVARALGVEGRGLITALIFAPQIILTICASGLGTAIAIHIGKKTWEVREIVQTLIILAIVSASVGMLLSLAWILLTWEDRYTPIMVAAAVMIVPGAVVYHYAAGVFLGVKRIPTYAVKAWGPGVGKFILTALLVLILGLGVDGAVAATALSSLLVASFFAWKLFRFAPARPKWGKDIARALTSTGFALSFVFLMIILVYRANVILIQQFGDLTQLGHYAIGSMFAELLWQIPVVFSALVVAKSAATKDGAGFSQKVATLARLILLTSITVSVAVAIIAPYLITFLYGREFAPSADIVRALLPGAVAITVLKTLRQDLSGKGRPWVALWVVFPMLMAAFAIGPIVIPVHGALGAAYMTSAIYVLGTISFMRIYCHVTEMPMIELVRYRKSDFTRAWGAISRKINSTFRR